MAIGPGKYDELCTLVRRMSEAEGAAVIIVRGEKGSGFSLQGPRELLTSLPTILREMADEIEGGA